MTTPHMTLGERFADAVAYASDLHREQVRKQTTTPYLSHLLGTAAFLMEQEGTTEDQAIAALLHDALEDHPDRTSAAEIEERFGATVARIVEDCSDTDVHPKPPWRERKEAYLAHLETAPIDSLQVSLADKLHNSRAILTDLQTIGPVVWTRFNAGVEEQRWYYTALAEVFVRRLGSPQAVALRATVAQLFDIEQSQQVRHGDDAAS